MEHPVASLVSQARLSPRESLARETIASWSRAARLSLTRDYPAALQVPFRVCQQCGGQVASENNFFTGSGSSSSGGVGRNVAPAFNNIAEIITMNFHLAGVAPLITVPVIMRMRVTISSICQSMLLFFCLIPFNCNVPLLGLLEQTFWIDFNAYKPMKHNKLGQLAGV